MPQTFLPGVINWNTGLSRREIEGVTLGTGTEVFFHVVQFVKSW